MRRWSVVFTLLVFLGVGAAGCSGCDDSSPTRPDAGEPPPPDGMPEPEVVVCETLPPVASGATCEVTAGGDAKLLKGVVLTPTKVYRGGQVAVDAGGQITCVGCDCAAGGETVISCPDGAISPGLINTHDHITFTQNAPYTDAGIRYEHRHQWRIGQDGKPKISSAGSASADAVRWGELRFLMGGATSIVGSGGQAGLLRNLDRANMMEGLTGQTAVNFDTFPLGDSNGTRRTSDCNYGTATTAADIANLDAYEPHTSEGIDTSARNEFLCQSSMDYDTAAPGVSNNLLLPKTALIHGIGLTPADYGAMAAAGTALIWSPRSNITLYGDTARVTTAARLGVEIALGTDWMPTGSMNLLRELKCADGLDATYYGDAFTDAQMWAMVTSNAAAITATDDVIGLLAPGKVADIAIFSAHGKTYRAVIDAEPEDIALVMRGGKVLYGEAAPVDQLAGATGSCDIVDVCGAPKRVCLVSEIGKTYDALKTGAGNIYPAFACGVPDNEPSCTPTRPMAVMGSTVYTGTPGPGDMDGDGLADADDKCPAVFDPVRPLDNGMQGDADGDGAGDACDPCPLDADTTTCSVVDPNDRDGDTVPNSADNCPDHSNTDQADGDTDGKGDVCDACPAASNPGAAGCPATIYSIKSGMTPVGTTVRVVNALVTGRGNNGFFVQVKEGDAGYMGADHSGMFVFTGTMTPTLAAATVGARVTIDGKVANFGGQLELDNVTSVTVDAVGPEAAPAPVAVTYAEIATGGPRALTLESVLVSLPGATVTAVDTMYGEFTLTSGTDTLIVDDFLFVPSPAPAVDQNYSSVRGILALRQSMSKLEPREASDLAAGPPTLASIGPALSYARVGTTANAPTFPSPLTVSLTGPAMGNTTVTIMSGSGNLVVADVTIPDGETSATVPVTAVAQNAAVTVTATLGMQTRTAQVRVLGTTEAPATVTLSPAAVTVPPGGNTLLTATLDIPALTTATVNLAATAGTVPATVTIAANQQAATFSYTNAPAMGSATVTATFGASTSTTTVTVSSAANHLVINEADYDQPSTDTAEYIEIFNPSGATVSLTGKAVVLVNGSNNTSYMTIDLAPAISLAPGEYLVIAGSTLAVPATAKKITVTVPSGGFAQNGAPDGIALIDTAASTLIDALSYEGSITAATLPGFSAAVSLVEGTAATAADDPNAVMVGAMCRAPNGQDTDEAADDWAVCTTLSPGAANP